MPVTITNPNFTEKVKNKDEIRKIEEHYDHHLNTIIPKDLHRGDLHSNKRLLGYIDAIMATCATFLVLPLRNLHEMKDGQTLKEFMYEVRLEFVIFFIGFFIVLTHWESINIRSFVIKRMDDLLVIFTIISLLAVTGLPFSLSLQGHFSNEVVPVVITCTLLALFEIVEFIIIFYATSTPRLLHLAMYKWSKTERYKLRNLMVIKCIVNIALALMGVFLCLHHYLYSWVFMGLLVFTPLVRKAINFLRRRFSKQTKMEKCNFFNLFSRGNVPKERVEAMSDAAVAIIACILILDMTVEDFPTIEQVKSHGLNAQLLHMKLEFYAFLLTYTIVSLLWYTNHSVLHLFRTINVVVLYSQKIFLAIICMLPLTSNMVTTFLKKDHNIDTNHSILLAALTIFFSSSANMCMLLYGLLTKNKYLHEWAYGKSLKANLRQHLYMIFKLINMPTWAFICALGSLGSARTATSFLYFSLIGMVGSFILLKIIFMNHCCKETLHHKDSDLELGIDHNENVRSKHIAIECNVIVGNNSGYDDDVDDNDGDMNDNDIEEMDLKLETIIAEHYNQIKTSRNQNRTMSLY